ncbi:spermidine synthase [Paenibacillus psychroresistens]|uniref:Spermidine synthase n=1 Tax=Paenibacillus psychroresistens TaxID=1778678 RepID=A0A6B8RJ76_9BACL|nr:fused MFS/spermidine synthase [Paenibacillus psychroresistens]QGQ95603.1 spermidine synthase [Paenibacillus psychroresistens]
MDFLFKEFSDNHEISVYDTAELFGEKGNFRVLQFSKRAIQGALDLSNPQRIVFEYPRAIIHLMEFNNSSFQDVFVIGHGIGTISGHYTEQRFKVAELDNTVVELSKQYFGYRKDDVIVGDGRQILENEAPQAYDYIILDAFTEKGTPIHLTSREFFRITRKKLNPQGAIILNLIGRGGNDKLLNAIHTTLREEYSYTKSFSLPSEGVTDIKNIIYIGSNRPIGMQDRHMAGFVEIKLGEGHIIRDNN